MHAEDPLAVPHDDPSNYSQKRRTATRLTSGTQPEIWMDFTSGFLAASFGTVTVNTPSSMAAFTWSTLASSGSRNLLKKLPLLRSTRCQVSVFSSSSRFLCPLIWRTRPSSTSTFSSSFFSPGTSALKTWEFGVSFQSTLAWTKDDVSAGKPERIWSERERKLLLNGQPSNGSHTSRENGSKTLDRRGISDIFRELSDLQRGVLRTAFTDSLGWNEGIGGPYRSVCDIILTIPDPSKITNSRMFYADAPPRRLRTVMEFIWASITGSFFGFLENLRLFDGHLYLAQNPFNNTPMQLKNIRKEK